MKKLVKMVAVLLLIAPMVFACESLNGELEEVKAGPEVIITETGGGESGGDTGPNGKPGG